MGRQTEVNPAIEEIYVTIQEGNHGYSYPFQYLTGNQGYCPACRVESAKFNPHDKEYYCTLEKKFIEINGDDLVKHELPRDLRQRKISY